MPAIDQSPATTRDLRPGPGPKDSTGSLGDQLWRALRRPWVGRDGRAGARRRRWRRLGTAWFAAVTLGVAPAARVDEGIDILIVVSAKTSTYRKVAQHVDSSANVGSVRVNTQLVDIEEFFKIHWRGSGAEPALVITVGVEAAEVAARSAVPAPILCTLIPLPRYEALRARLAQQDVNARRVSAIYLDQAPERQMQLIKSIMPDSRIVATVLGPISRSHELALGSAAKQAGLSLRRAIIDDERDLFRALSDSLDGADVLLAVPDPWVFNQHTAQNILLESYRRRVPLVGYSQAYVDAGAVVAVYSTPEQIGLQAGQVVRSIPREGAWRLPKPSYPKYFTVQGNPRVARSLGLQLPSDRILQRRLSDSSES